MDKKFFDQHKNDIKRLASSYNGASSKEFIRKLYEIADELFTLGQKEKSLITLSHSAVHFNYVKVLANPHKLSDSAFKEGDLNAKLESIYKEAYNIAFPSQKKFINLAQEVIKKEV